jgi:hypothetical protein
LDVLFCLDYRDYGGVLVNIDTTDMEGELVNFLDETGDRLNTPLTLGFAGDDSDIEPLTGMPDRYQAIAELRQFLKTLRQELENSPLLCWPA